MGKRKTFGNIDAYIKNQGVRQKAAWAAGAWANDNFDRSSLAGHRMAAQAWPGKLVLKGILDVADATTAAAVGADAIVVSNHGGRQLDGAPSTIAALPRSPTSSPAASKCCSMAASAPARTCSRRWRSAPTAA